MAELARFELANGFHRYTLSKRAPSTTRTQLQQLISEKDGRYYLAQVKYIRQLFLGFVPRAPLPKKLGKYSRTLKMLNPPKNRKLMIQSLILV
jgi:hypothetical protein